MDCLEKDGLDHPFLCPWMDGIPQRARKAVRLCPWMDGLKIAPAFSALPTFMWVVSAKSQEGGAVMSMDGRYSAKSQERQCGCV